MRERKRGVRESKDCKEEREKESLEGGRAGKSKDCEEERERERGGREREKDRARTNKDWVK